MFHTVNQSSPKGLSPSACRSSFLITALFIDLNSIVSFLPVKVNFMYHLDWAMGYPDSWEDIILGVSVKMFLGEINI